MATSSQNGQGENEDSRICDSNAAFIFNSAAYFDRRKIALCGCDVQCRPVVPSHCGCHRACLDQPSELHQVVVENRMADQLQHQDIFYFLQAAC